MRDSLAIIYLSNTLPQLLYPAGSTVVLLAVASVMLARRHVRAARAIVLVALAWLWVTSTPFVAEGTAGALEHAYPPIAPSKSPTADVAIVLGGGAAEAVPPRAELELIQESNRLLHAARLYHAGKVKRILLIGGNLPWNTYPVAEADLMRQLMLEWGVPDGVMVMAGRSRNTYENAAEALELRRTSNFDSALLVTSAIHMPRAMAIFQHAGLPVVASSVDVKVVDHATSIIDFLPSAEALALTTHAMKEMIGLVVYRLRGRL